MKVFDKIYRTKAATYKISPGPVGLKSQRNPNDA